MRRWFNNKFVTYCKPGCRESGTSHTRTCTLLSKKKLKLQSFVLIQHLARMNYHLGYKKYVRDCTWIIQSWENIFITWNKRYIIYWEIHSATCNHSTLSEKIRSIPHGVTENILLQHHNFIILVSCKNFNHHGWKITLWTLTTCTFKLSLRLDL